MRCPKALSKETKYVIDTILVKLDEKVHALKPAPSVGTEKLNLATLDIAYHQHFFSSIPIE